MKELPYGSWPSPITAKFITSSSVRLGSLSVDKEGELYWLEGRPQEKGRQVVVRYEGMGRATGPAADRGATDVTPAAVNVRTRVHEYGGGSYALTPDGGLLYCDFGCQRLYYKREGAEPVCLVPADRYASGRYRFADFSVDASRGRVVCVREDHGDGADAKPSAVVNEVVSVALDGSGEMEVLARGKDFYAAPRVSPDGATLAYVCWDHPSMPWDATELRATCAPPPPF